jgi:flagellar basal-body rod modification protein FlgD
MSALAGVTAAPPATASADRNLGSSAGLGQADFLRLMTAQVASQDPFKPLDQTAMLGQLAQFSQVAGTAEMNVALTDLLGAVRSQSDLLIAIRDQLSAANPPTTTTGA